MPFQLGRVGRTITVLEPETWADLAGTITVSGRVIVSPSSDAVRLRDQFLGYQDNLDEPVVPVIFDGEPRLTGYYRVLSVSVTSDQRMVSTGFVTYQVILEPVLGFTSPAFESVMTDALLTNVVGAVTGDVQTFHAVPIAALEYFWVTTLGSPGVRATDDSGGGVHLFVSGGSFGGSNTMGSSIVRFSVSPQSFYDGGAQIEQGAVLQPIVGRLLTQADPTHWRLSNGMIRVTPSAVAGRLDVSHYNGVTWSAAKSYILADIAGGGLGTVNSFTSITVLRNCVEESIIRLSATVSTFNGHFVDIDIAVRRGDVLARIYVTTTRTARWQIARAATEAATAITYSAVTAGGIRATNNDGDGNRYVLLSYGTATTSDLVNGKISQNALSGTFDCGIGSVIGGSGAVAPSDAVSIAEQYLAVQGESQRIVAR